MTPAELHAAIARGEWHRAAPLLQEAARSVRVVAQLDGDEQDEIVQRTLIKCWTIGYVPDNPVAFAKRVARNLALDRRKAVANDESGRRVSYDEAVQRSLQDHAPHHTVDDGPAFQVSEPLAIDTLLQRENVGRLRQALRRLPDPVRRVVALAHLHGKTHEQIAATLGISVPCSKMRLLRGLRLLGHLYQTTPAPALRRNVPMTAGRPPKPQVWRQVAA